MVFVGKLYCSSNKTSTSTDVPRCTSKLSITQRVQQMSSCPNVKPKQPKSFQFYTYWHEPAFGKMNSRSGGWFHPPQCDSWWAVAPCFLLRRWSTSLGPVDESSCHDGEMKRPGFRYQRRHLSVVGKIRKKDKLNVSLLPTIYVCSNRSAIVIWTTPMCLACNYLCVRTEEWADSTVWFERSYCSIEGFLCQEVRWVILPQVLLLLHVAIHWHGGGHICG